MATLAAAVPSLWQKTGKDWSMCDIEVEGRVKTSLGTATGDPLGRERLPPIPILTPPTHRVPRSRLSLKYFCARSLHNWCLRGAA